MTMPTLLSNKKAKFDYTIIESFQAGMSLQSLLVKQIRSKKVILEGKYVIAQGNGLELIDFGNELIKQNIPLLLNKKEIQEIKSALSTKGISCVPLSIKSIGRWLKVEIALVKGKKKYDKRQALKERDNDRAMRRNISTFDNA